jgi:hypothetical protein
LISLMALLAIMALLFGHVDHSAAVAGSQWA